MISMQLGLPRRTSRIAILSLIFLATHGGRPLLLGASGLSLRRGSGFAQPQAPAPVDPLTPDDAAAAEPPMETPISVTSDSPPPAGRLKLQAAAAPGAKIGNSSASSSGSTKSKVPYFLQEDDSEMPMDPTYCDPPCIEGQGTCNDNRCFCKSPWEGTTCQHKVKTGPLDKNIGPTLSTGIIIMSLCLGLMTGFCAFQVLVKLIFSQNEVGEKLVRKETWKPSEGEPSKKKKGAR